MIKNYYYLVAGVLAILFAFTHSWNGQTAVLPTLDVPSVSLETKTTFIHIWNIITAENFLFGISFLIMAFYKDLSQVRFTAVDDSYFDDCSFCGNQCCDFGVQSFRLQQLYS